MAYSALKKKFAWQDGPPKGGDFFLDPIEEAPRGAEGAPGNPDLARIAADITGRVLPTLRAEVQREGGNIEQRVNKTAVELMRSLESALYSRLEMLEDAVLARVLARAPVRVELTRAGAALPEVEGHQHPGFSKLLRALASRQVNGYAPNVWLAGPAGSGKTHAAGAAAQALGVAFHYNGALSMPHELLGFVDAGGKYHRTPFREAYEHGGVYLFDEVDGSDNSALLALNAALANARATFPDAQVTRHGECYVVATANTWGLGATADYVGRSKIDAAFLSRFPVRLAWGYDEVLERTISGHEGFARRVQRARERARVAGLKVLLDPRASIAGAALIASGFTENEAAEMTYLANLTADQRRVIENV